MKDDNERTQASESAPERQSRQRFLGAAIVAGGAVYLDPAAAVAATAPLTRGDTAAGSSATPIAKLVEGTSVPATLTPHDLAVLADGDPAGVQQLARAYPDLRFGQLRSIVDAAIKKHGGDTRIFTGGPTGGMVAFGCCCCCTFTININSNNKR
jgi:hypothetical protein